MLMMIMVLMLTTLRMMIMLMKMFCASAAHSHLTAAESRSTVPLCGEDWKKMLQRVFSAGSTYRVTHFLPTFVCSFNYQQLSTTLTVFWDVLNIVLEHWNVLNIGKFNFYFPIQREFQSCDWFSSNNFLPLKFQLIYPIRSLLINSGLLFFINWCCWKNTVQWYACIFQMPAFKDIHRRVAFDRKITWDISIYLMIYASNMMLVIVMIIPDNPYITYLSHTAQSSVIMLPWVMKRKQAKLTEPSRVHEKLN